MTQYTATIVNNSGEPWDMVLFHKNPNLSDPQIHTLAWFAKSTAANSQVKFIWDDSYNFIWSQVGNLVPGTRLTTDQASPADPNTSGVATAMFALVPGAQFIASQTFPADPNTSGIATATSAANQAVLTYRANDDYFEFTSNAQPLPSTNPGALYVRCDDAVPNGLASVGIGMSGSGTFALTARANVINAFVPQPTYYVAAMVSVEQGQALDDEISQSVELDYDGVTSLAATFNPDHTWTVTPG